MKIVSNVRIIFREKRGVWRCYRTESNLLPLQDLLVDLLDSRHPLHTSQGFFSASEKMSLREARTCVRLDEPTFNYDGDKLLLCLSPTRWINASFMLDTHTKE